MPKLRPEFTVYSGIIKIGQSVTWHGALSLLVNAECLAQYSVTHTGTQYLLVKDNAGNSYRIVRER